jgi:putative ABC transport system ATP-binding protein
MLLSRSIHFKYDDLPPFDLPDLHLNPGDELLVLGKSGSGKTTLLHILGGLLKPQSGEVIIDGTNIYSLRGNALDKFRGEKIGIVFQKPHILSPLTVAENLQIANFFVGKNTGETI